MSGTIRMMSLKVALLSHEHWQMRFADVRFTICCRTTIGDLEGLFDNYSHKYDWREFVILYARWGPLLCRRGMG